MGPDPDADIKKRRTGIVQDIGIHFEKRGRAGVITLDRQETLNAVTDAMLSGIAEHLTLWETDTTVDRILIRASSGRAFSAGGDIRHLYECGTRGDYDFGFFAREYALNARIAAYPKDYVALVDGIAMGGGVGVSFHGSHVVAGDKASFAMPEVGIGFFPDVGGSYLLSRTPGYLGLYLGLTGARLKQEALLQSGLATHACPSGDFADLEEALYGKDDTDAILARFSARAGDDTLDELMDRTDRTFAADSVQAITEKLEDLEVQNSEMGAWAKQTRATLAQKSPLSLCIAFRQIREAKGLSMEDCMRMEYRILRRILPSPDFYEGIRAAIIEKDGRPTWNPPRLSDVTPGQVAAHFEPLDEELDLT